MKLLFLIYYSGKREYDYCLNILQEHDNNIFQEFVIFYLSK